MAVKASLKELRAENKRKAKTQGEALRRIAVVERSEILIEALERLILDNGALRFRTLGDLLAPQPWALADGSVLGHLLVVEESDYLEAITEGSYEVWGLDEALAREWTSPSAMEAWVQVYTEVLRSHADLADMRLKTRTERDALMVHMPTKAPRPKKTGPL